MKTLVEFIAEKCCKKCKIKNFDKDILKKKNFKHLKFKELKKLLNESYDEDDENDYEEYYETFEDDVATFLYNWVNNGDEEETQEMLEYFIKSRGEGELWDMICEDLSNDPWGGYQGEYDEWELADDDFCKEIAVMVAKKILEE
ncbi:MAG: hypothetical protein J1F35_06220 [Erysipelotrichales bacterium]|nr:hypothetical protein [Erysipelotrichales bacterium]